MVRSQDWCWTAFTSFEDAVALQESLLNEEVSVFSVFQLEKAATGNEHVQGFTQFKARKRFETVRRLLGGIHVECRRGTVEEAIEYCRKDDTAVQPFRRREFGVPEMRDTQGRRNDLGRVVDLLRGGTGIVGVAQNPETDITFIRYHAGIERWWNVFNTPALPGTRAVYVFYGPPGAGKTSEAENIAESRGNPIYWLEEPDSGPAWWTGYDGQRTVIIDEFADGWLGFNLLMRICNPEPIPVQVRIHRDYTPFVADCIILTTNIPPWEWYPKLDRRADRIGGLKRRITEIFTVLPGDDDVPIVIPVGWNGEYTDAQADKYFEQITQVPQ